MNDYSFEFCILKYMNMYFLEEEIQIFLLGPLVNLYAPPPLPLGLSGVVLGTGMTILYYLPVKCIKHNVICPPKYFWM